MTVAFKSSVTFPILVALLAGSAATAAAVPGGTAPRTPRAASAGGLHFTASGEVLYDSNQLRTGSRLGGHRDDYRYSPALSATYARSTGRLSLDVDGLIGRDYLQYNRYLNRNRYVGSGVVTYRSGASCQASINGSYASRQSGLRGADSLVDNVDNPDDIGIVIDNVQTSTGYGANLGCGSPSGRLSFGVGYSHSTLTNGAPTRRFGDSEGDTYSANVGIGILRPGQLSLNGSYSTVAYPGRFAGVPIGNIPPQLLNSGVRTYRIGVSFSRPIGTRLSGTVGASFLHADPAGGQAPYNSPAYNFGLTYTASPRLSFAFNGSRDILASTSAGALYRVVDSLQLSSQYRLGRAVTLDANAGLISNNYKQPFTIPGEFARSTESTKLFGVGLTYAPRRLYDVRLAANQTFRTANPSIFNYDSTKLSVTLAVHI